MPFGLDYDLVDGASKEGARKKGALSSAVHTDTSGHKPASQPLLLPQPGLCIACRCVHIGGGLFDATFTQLRKAHLYCYFSHSSFALQSISWPWSP